MAQVNGHSILARKVLSQIIKTYTEKSFSSEETQASLDKALESLIPFKPDPADIRSINRFLVHHQASDLACKSAWALYKDLVNNEPKDAP